MLEITFERGRYGKKDREDTSPALFAAGITEIPGKLPAVAMKINSNSLLYPQNPQYSVPQRALGNSLHKSEVCHFISVITYGRYFVGRARHGANGLGIVFGSLWWHANFL